MTDSVLDVRSAARGCDRLDDLVMRWQTSGLTQQEFCKRHGIAVSTFHYRRARISRAFHDLSERTATAKAPESDGDDIAGSFREVVCATEPLGVLGSSSPSPTWAIEVEISGAVVRFAESVEPLIVTSILKAVRSAC